MSNRINLMLRALCALLALLLLAQLSRALLGRGPFADFDLADRITIQESGSETNTASQAPAPPPEVLARVNAIQQSEIVGQIMRPPPMAVLGIAGRDVLFRAPNGQTGLLREGEELGGVKLLKIGVNRVLIEQEKEQKELLIFEGFGGETLLSQGKDK